MWGCIVSLVCYCFLMQRGFSAKGARGVSFVKMILTLIILGVLGGMCAFVYFGWQKTDLTGIDGREEIIKSKGNVRAVNVLEKLRNAYDGNYEVKLTEEELNRYIAEKLKMKQGGWMKGFATIKGVYVDLREDEIEVFIEREIAQYGEDGKPKLDIIKPFDQTVSMKLKVATLDLVDADGKKQTSIRVDFPGGSIGKAPAPGMFVKLVQDSFAQIQQHFNDELELGYERIVRIKIGDGFITLDPRKMRSTQLRTK